MIDDSLRRLSSVKHFGHGIPLWFTIQYTYILACLARCWRCHARVGMSILTSILVIILPCSTLGGSYGGVEALDECIERLKSNTTKLNYLIGEKWADFEDILDMVTKDKWALIHDGYPQQSPPFLICFLLWLLARSLKILLFNTFVLTCINLAIRPLRTISLAFRSVSS